MTPSETPDGITMK